MEVLRFWSPSSIQHTNILISQTPFCPHLLFCCPHFTLLLSIWLFSLLFLPFYFTFFFFSSSYFRMFPTNRIGRFSHLFCTGAGIIIPDINTPVRWVSRWDLLPESAAWLSATVCRSSARAAAPRSWQQAGRTAGCPAPSCRGPTAHTPAWEGGISIVVTVADPTCRRNYCSATKKHPLSLLPRAVGGGNVFIIFVN